LYVPYSHEYETLPCPDLLTLKLECWFYQSIFSSELNCIVVD
jgi:hypothetical protein